MSLGLTRGATAVALAASLGLVALPACKKKKPPTEPDSPSTQSPNAGPPRVAAPTFGAGDIPGPPVGPFFGPTTEFANKAAATSDLKQILLALLSFHEAHRAFPAGYADKTGKPGLSWRVALLPHLGEDALFKQFKLDEAWDSPHNRKLIGNMPIFYAPPRQRTFGYTFYRGFTGPNTWLPPQSKQAQPGQMLFGATMSQFSDGLSNTILVAEADPVIWTKPEEVAFTPGAAPKLGGVFTTGFNVGMGDGSARFLRSNVSARALASAIQINDGGVVNLDD